MCADKVDSNITGLRFTEEDSIRVLPAYTAPVAASGRLTFGEVGTQGNTFTIGSRTYELRNAFDSDQDEIIIGTTPDETAQNVATAINTGASGAIVGAGTLAHADVVATVAGSVVTLTARATGVAGNAIATTDVITGASFNTATLTGGVDQVGTPPIWYPLEPNSYSDFGGAITTIARNPINPTRQRKKGVTTDLEASGGFNQDFTFGNSTRLLQGFFFADAREKFTTQSLNAAAIAITSVVNSTSSYGAVSGLDGLIAGDLLLAEGFANAANNGIKTVVSSASASIVVTEATVDEATPPAAAKLTHIGYQFGSGEVTFVLNGGLLQLLASGAEALPLLPGEWIFIGGDTVATSFTTAIGFARVKRLGSGFIEFDKTTFSTTAEVVPGTKTIQIFYGNIIRNEPDPDNVKRRTYQLERTLGRDEDGTMSEYLVGAVPNELTLNIGQADKLAADFTFIAVDNEQRDGDTGVKDGTRPALAPEEAYNTSSDFARIKLAMVDDDADILPLFAYATEASLTINNNVSPDKAVGVLGAFDTSAGTFEVGGALTAYFANVQAVQAVRNNANITLDIILAKANQGILWDVPLIALGDGRLNVEQDQSITLPLETNAAESAFGYTLLFQWFPYLPNIAG